MKNIIQFLFGLIGFEIKRLKKKDAYYQREYINAGKKPWGPGYRQIKKKLIEQTCANPKIINIFKENNELPFNYGVGIDERCIEYPWLIANLPNHHIKLLDAGSVLNHDFMIRHPMICNNQMHILTLAPEKNCYWYKGITYLYSDMREIPIKDNFYDVVVCLSSLEHVGFDNTGFVRDGINIEIENGDFVDAMKELRRVLKPAGTLLMSVPYGVNKNYLLFQQFDQNLLSRAIGAFGKHKKVTKEFYRYTIDGWNLSDEEKCKNCEYIEWIVKAWKTGKMPKSIPVEPDQAASARSVACVKIVKD